VEKNVRILCRLRGPDLSLQLMGDEGIRFN
jgi:hypothetical protein